MDLLAQAMKILEENYPNIEKSTAVIRGVMEKITCYEALLKEKQQKKKQQSITSFFRLHTPSQVTESETDDESGDTLEEEVAKQRKKSNGGGGGGGGVRTPLKPRPGGRGCSTNGQSGCAVSYAHEDRVAA
ncbi:hypothetical protein E2C01_097161 [Portunus trituberculatus]|uniref:Uncharacterized protein n=1 Tax=Portunus trituberculatus TaxID=210409 RepID=A0A5B7KAH8_PORTR|nr:hypothetical protein [Portunus trituberculatus]